MNNKTNTILLSLILVVVVVIAILLLRGNSIVNKQSENTQLQYSDPSEEMPAAKEISYNDLSTRYLTIKQNQNSKGEFMEFTYTCNSTGRDAEIVRMFSIKRELREPVRAGDSGLFSRRAYVCGNDSFIEQMTTIPSYFGPFSK